VDEQNLPKAVSGITVPLNPEHGERVTGTLVFFGDPAQVSEGFAMALHAMGIGASMVDVVAPDPSEQGE
jgi:homoaconitase/3-isopropylmalate dehydratase large subunit